MKLPSILSQLTQTIKLLFYVNSYTLQLSMLTHTIKINTAFLKLSMPISSSKYIKGDKLVWYVKQRERWGMKKNPLIHKVGIWKIKFTLFLLLLLQVYWNYPWVWLPETQGNTQPWFYKQVKMWKQKYTAILNLHSISCFQKKNIQTLVALKKANNKETIMSQGSSNRGKCKISVSVATCSNIH